jgi:uncharacterized damage-inducible protein DinB
MKRISFAAFAVGFLLVGGLACAAHASQPLGSQQAAQSTQAKDTTPPSYDMKAQSLQDLDIANQKFVALAKAIPAEKYTWRPDADSRTVGEVLLHVSAERYGILALMGAPGTDPFDPKSVEKIAADKDQVLDALNKSWEYAKATIEKMTNADFAKPQPKLGPDANSGDVVYILVGDAHEHLGQMIAYARFNGIAPPWTVAAKKRAAAAAPAAKPQQ